MIQSISLYNINKYNLRNNNFTKSKNKTFSINSSYQISNITYRPNFRGKSISKLYDEYNWYLYHDKVPAIKSFLKIDETSEIMDNFLTEILKTTDRSKEFFDSFLYQPRKINEISKSLKLKIGDNSLNLLSFLPNSPYRTAYIKYVEDKVANERSLMSLLKLRPDWKGDVLLEKYKALYNSDNLQIGNIPKEFPNNHLEQISKFLRNEMEEGVKSKKKIPSLNLDGHQYEFAYFTEGRSDKNVFGIFTQEGKKFVLKMGKPEKRSLDAPFALGTLAKIDSYLTMHRCRNSAPLCYYNHKNNFSLYKYIEHIPVSDDTSSLQTIIKHLNDFKALGLNYNDTVGYKNFFMLDLNSSDYICNTEGFIEGLNNKEWISVDNDHVTYSNSLQPLISKYHAPLPNAMQMFF